MVSLLGAGLAALISSQTSPSEEWQRLAEIWIHEVPEQLLATCLQRTDTAGVVEVGLDTAGQTSVTYRVGGAEVQRCAAIVASKLGAVSRTSGITKALYFGLPEATPGDPVRTARPAFSKCSTDTQCGPGEACDATDAGVCLDIRSLLKLRSPAPVEERGMPPGVHILPRNSPYCASVGSLKDGLILRVIDTAHQPMDALLTVIAFRHRADGGIWWNDIIEHVGVREGRGFTPAAPVLVAFERDGCTSQSAFIEPGVRACVLFVVRCSK